MTRKSSIGDEVTADLTIVVVAYRMQRELPRTILSLSRGYQTGVDDIAYEIVVIDNDGESPPLPDPGVPLRRVVPAELLPSPALAVNAVIAATRTPLVAVVLDGARLVTPGAVAASVGALETVSRSFATPAAFHLGPAHQSSSVADGYDAATEDALLEGIRWPADGYRLFEISALAGSNPLGILGPLNESCFLMLPRRDWDAVGGFDRGFVSPGGGAMNLDLFTRLITSGLRPVVTLAEGSFHQVHGGVTTAGRTSDDLWAEYERLRGHPYVRPDVAPLYVGEPTIPGKAWLRVTAP